MDPFYGRAMLDWPLMIASAVIFGTTMFVIAARRLPGSSTAVMTGALLSLWRALSVIAVVAAPLLLLSMTAEMAGVSWWTAIPLTREVMAQTHSGEVCRCCVPGAGFLLMAAFMPLRSTMRLATLSILSGVILLCQALLSHAVDKGGFAVAVFFVHEAAAGLWIGALAGFWIVARRVRPTPEWITRGARLVSTMAAWSVAAIVLSGAYAAWQELGLSLDRLLFSSYGRMLIIKVVVFSGVLCVGAYNRERLLPDLSDRDASRMLLRNVGLESLILAVVVMGLASLLANTPPAKGHMMMHPGVASEPIPGLHQG